MYKLNELAFEVMLEEMKRLSNGNLSMKLSVDKVSYEYNREQYNECLRRIDEESNHIAAIYNQISQRGGFITAYEQWELQKHIQTRNEYEVKSMKHFLSGLNDAHDAQSIINNMYSK